jgi:diadenosine tetraphosphate (Ap4A) HIT family hydrolase
LLKLEGCKFCYLDSSEQILKETENYFIIPSVGSIVPGYLLLISKLHFPSCGSIDKSLIDEFLKLKSEAKTVLEQAFGKGCIFYEHGRAGSSLTLKQKAEICYHAHLHCVAVDIDLEPEIAKDNKEIIVDNWAEVINLTDTNPDYLYFENKTKMYFFPVSTYKRPQYLRHLLAKCVDKQDTGDWKQFPKIENMTETVERTKELWR